MRESKSMSKIDDKTQIASAVPVACPFYPLVMQATPDTCSKHVSKTPKALHKQADTPSHFPDKS